MFGPHDHFGEDGHVIGALIQKCVTAQKKNDELEVWGGGSAVRQFLYAPDVARIMADLIFREDIGNWIVAADDGISIKKLAQLIARAAGFTGPIRFDESKPEGIHKKILRSDSFDRLFPKFRFTPIEKAVAETVEWCRSNQKTRAKAGGVR